MYLQPVAKEQLEILQYLNKNLFLDFKTNEVVAEQSNVTNEMKQTKYIYTKSKAYHATEDGTISIKTVLVDHHPCMGITFNKQIAGEQDEDEPAQNEQADEQVSKPKKKKKAQFFCINTNWIRKLVSTNKKRLEVEGYNLDLTYITNRVIACGFPAEGIE